MADDRNYDAAIRRHETFNALNIEASKTVINAGISILRALGTINAGGLIALLAFISAIAGKEKPVFTNVAALMYI